MIFTGTSAYTYEGKETEYHYAVNASYMEQAAFVISVTDGVIINGNYVSALKDVIFNLKLVQSFTDIDMSQFYVDNGLNLDMFASFDEETGVSDMLKVFADDGVIDSLISALDDNIAYRTGMRRDGVTEAVVGLIKTITARVATFGNGLDADATMDFIQKFTESDISGESIVNAYLNSDNYKKNKADNVVPIKGE